MSRTVRRKPWSWCWFCGRRCRAGLLAVVPGVTPGVPAHRACLEHARAVDPEWADASEICGTRVASHLPFTPAE